LTKIYEALESAGSERAPKKSIAPKQLSLGLPDSLEDKFIALYQRIERMVDVPRTRIVEFIGIQKGEDSSRIIYAFAKVVASRFHKRVLLVTGGRFPRVRATFFGDESDQLEDALRAGKFVDAVVHPIDESLGKAIVLSTTSYPLQQILTAPESESLANDLREQFDLVLVDAPPLGGASGTPMLTSIADGVVFVVEAGSTRWQVAKHAIDDVAQRQRVLGVIINKRRFYIPKFVYRWL
jgi:Mrp family chromosome partitioning ATPase